MRKLQNFQKLNDLLRKPLFTAAEARKLGVHPSLLSYYLKKGLIEKVDRGIYKASESSEELDFKWEDLILASKSVPSGVVCLISALALYELTDEIPRVHWIAVPHSTKAPRRKGVKIVRMRNMVLAQSSLQIGNQSIPTFDRERTIVDAFRYLSKEVAIKALKSALGGEAEKKANLVTLQKYAKELRVNLTPYLMAFTEGHSERGKSNIPGRLEASHT